jgi:inner membrane protein
MDSLTQGFLGGVAAQATLPGRENFRQLSWAGFIGGMVPDLDILIRSRSDPLMPLVYHRHFTHSLIFIPLGGFLTAVILWLLIFRHQSFKWVWLATTIGLATAGLLDACTSYGTQLFWPFSNTRVAWNIISIIDPIFSLFLILGFVIALVKKVGTPARVALFFAMLYLALGTYQHSQALRVQSIIAHRRGHIMEKNRVDLSLGNLLVWRSLYESDGKIYTDAIRVFPGTKDRWWAGDSAKKFNFRKFEASLPPNTTLRRDLKIYEWFTAGYGTLYHRDPPVVADLRYSAWPSKIKPLWGIVLDPEKPQKHVRRIRFDYPLGDAFKNLWDKILGN